MSPTRSALTTRRAAQRTIDSSSQRHDQAQRRGVVLGRDVDDLGRPEPAFELAFAAEQHFVEPDWCCLANAVRVVDQRSAVVVDDVHHRVPVAAEIGCYFRHGSAVMADLERRPTTRPVGDPGAVSSNATV